MCPTSPPRIIPGHSGTPGTLRNAVEPGRTMTSLDRKFNEAWNQYVQCCITCGTLGNGVSGVVMWCFNHKDLENIPTLGCKHGGYHVNHRHTPRYHTVEPSGVGWWREGGRTREREIELINGEKEMRKREAFLSMLNGRFEKWMSAGLPH